MTKFQRNRGRNRRGGRRRFQNHRQGQGNHNASYHVEQYIKPPTCVECDKAAPAYKCPTCSQKYCSVVCCKEHKTRCSSSATPEPVVTSTPAPSANVCERPKRHYTYEFPTEDTVPLDKLLQIKDDERIHTLLKSAKLRALITKLDEVQNPTNSFRDIMKDPEFRAFSNTVLEIVGVKDDYNISQ